MSVGNARVDEAVRSREEEEAATVPPISVRMVIQLTAESITVSFNASATDGFALIAMESIRTIIKKTAAEWNNLRFFRGFISLFEKDEDRNGGADDGTHLLMQSEQGIHAQCGAAYVSHVKGKFARSHGKGRQLPRSRDNPLGTILSSQIENADDTPDVEPHHRQRHKRHGDGKNGERQKLPGENRSLWQKSRADGRRRHEKRRPRKTCSVPVSLLCPIPSASPGLRWYKNKKYNRSVS